MKQATTQVCRVCRKSPAQPSGRCECCQDAYANLLTPAQRAKLEKKR